MESVPKAPAKQDLELLPVEKIVPSKTNPRKTFDPAEQKRLEDSVAQLGVQSPIKVRPQNGHFEIVYGERRFRAAKKAGLPRIPALVQSLTDDQVLEIQVVENQQRSDVHPLEEADGYRALLKRQTYSVASIAKKIGLTESYVYMRLKLCDLIEPARKAFLADKITAGHAEKIARLQPKDQRDALEACHVENDDMESIGPDYDRQVEPDPERTVSVREISRWIQTFVHLDLAQAPWNQANEKLLPKAGPCTTCPKRELDGKKATCSDRACFAQKYLAWIQSARGNAPVVVADLNQDDLERLGIAGQVLRRADMPTLKPGEVLNRGRWHRIVQGCSSIAKALVAYGEKKGEFISVCMVVNCEPRQKALAAKSKSASSAKVSEADRKRNREEEARREKEIVKRKATELARERIYREVIESTDRIGRRELEVLAIACEGLPYMHGRDVEWLPDLYSGWDRNKRIAGIEKAGDMPLAKYLVASALGGELGDRDEARMLYRIARLHRIKVEAIEKAAVKAVVDQRAHHERRQRWKDRVAAQAKTFAVLTCRGCGRTQAEQAKGGWHWAAKNDKSKAGLCSTCGDLEKG